MKGLCYLRIPDEAMATTIIFCSFEYTLLDSFRLSMDPDFVHGGRSTH